MKIAISAQFERLQYKPIERRLAPIKRRALFRMSGFVRNTMRDLIGKPVKSRKPRGAGKPPRAHAKRKPNLRTIVFAVDLKDESSVIGPIEFKGRKTAKPAPQLLEHGGATRQTLADGSRRRIRIKKHPFAEPALSQELPKFPELLRG